ncbi:uncharacterized protein TNCV_3832321 [Trichonephila clavipes]|nr:uncharacterized protein TNCV_3832321 [Trichonephila clavipes]
MHKCISVYIRNTAEDVMLHNKTMHQEAPFAIPFVLSARKRKKGGKERRKKGEGSFVRVRSCAPASKSRYSSSDDTTEWNSINASKPLTHKMRKAFLDIAVTRIHLPPFLSARWEKDILYVWAKM